MRLPLALTLAPVVLLCSFVVAAASMMQSAAAADPLSITLTAPTTCEADFDDRQAAPELEVTWQVSGGAAPYSVVVDGVRYSDASGVATVLCGIWQLDQVESGVTVIQAHVTDAEGASAGAVAYVYAIRVIRADHIQNVRGVSLTAGHTYRVHGLLLTVPEGFGLGVGDYLTADCALDDEQCDDQFRLSGSGGQVSLRRWHADEASRSVDASGIFSADEVHSALDELVASIGQPPSLAQLPPNLSAASSDELTLRMIAPAICEENGPYYRPSTSVVAWEISGGTNPYNLIIDGQQTAASSGDIHAQCGELFGRETDSGLHSVHGIVVDADGRVASNVVHTYGIKDIRGGATLNGGNTYRLFGQLLTFPEGVTAEVGDYAEVECTAYDDPGYDSSYVCEDYFGLVVTIGDVRAYTSFGVDTGREDDTRGWVEPTPGPAHPIHAKLDALAASIGQPPSLPDDHAAQLAPLKMSAYADPPSCIADRGMASIAAGENWTNWGKDGITSGAPVGGGAVNIYWSVTGGFWTPVTVRLNDRDPSAHRMVYDCRDQSATPTVELHVVDKSDPPQESSATVAIDVLPVAGDNALDLLAYPFISAYCEPGAHAMIGWGLYGEASPVTVSIDGVDGEFGRAGALRMLCQDEVGTQTVTVRASETGDTERSDAVDVHLVVTDDPPEFVNLVAAVAPSGGRDCTAGSSVELIWSAIGGVPPYEVSVPGDDTATIDDESITIICPAAPGDHALRVEVRDSGFRPRIQIATVWLNVATADPEP